MRLRTTARWALVALAVAGLLLALQRGPTTPVTARAQQPDVYQASAAAAATDTRNYQTGSPVDPSPAVNTAVPLATIVADNEPKTDAHAAYAEPPQTAQAATGLNNVPVPYPTQAEALCANCSAPVVRDAEGSSDQNIDGSRFQGTGGHAHTEAASLTAVADAADGRQTVGPDDQVADLYDAAVSDLYAQVVDKPAPSASPPPPGVPPPFNQPPQCTAVPQPGPSLSPSTAQVCPSALPLTHVLARASAADATTTITTDANGTVVDSVSVLSGTQILDGLITIGAIHVEVRASGDGTDAASRVVATNDVEDVCVGSVCNLSLTAAGVCSDASSVQACVNDPVNQQLRQHGINVCRLGAATSGEKTSTVTGTAAGVLVEFHAQGTASNGYEPDAHYFDGQDGICSAGSPTPRPGYSGINSFTVLGESSVQLFTRSFPACTVCGEAGTEPVALSTGGITGLPAFSPGGTNTTTTVVAPGPAGSRGTPAGALALGTPQVATTAAPLHDRRPLELAAFALLEIVLLGNLTLMAAMRRNAR